VAFDDLALDFPAHTLPDLNPTTTTRIVPLLEGSSTPVQVNLGRVNGSSGPVQISAADLPTGVTAQVAGNPVTGNAATLTLNTAADAPSTDFRPVRVQIQADPLHNAKVAPAVRDTTLDVRVASPFDLQLAPNTIADVALPACAPVDVPIELPRDSGLRDSIHLSVTGLPRGVSATVLPSPDVAPGGGLTANRTIELTRAPGAALPADVTVRAGSPDATRTLALHLTTAAATASLSPGLGLTPRLGADGTEINVSGNGFCPGTSVEVGNSSAIVSASTPDPHTLTFHMPRLATSGPVTVLPPAGDQAYLTGNSLTVDSFRNVDGFQFRNFPFDGLSLGELTDAFGVGALFVSVNPCGLWGGDCSITTPILNPLAAIEWPIISKALTSSGGHCFGISRAVQEFLDGKKSPRPFTPGSIFSIPAADHPHDDIAHFLDSQHALQASDQFLSAYFFRARSLKAQVLRLQSAMARHDYPIVSLRHGLDGHALLAYDSVTNPDGTVDIHAYDSNRPFTPLEDQRGDLHAGAVNHSVIHVDPDHGSWSYLMDGGETWTGGDNTLFVAPESVIPQDPSLPGLDTLEGALASLDYIVFGSQGNAVRIAAPPKGAQYLPALDSHAIPGAGGTVISRASSHTPATEFVGRARGRYSAAVVDRGFIASVAGVATQPGVHDELQGHGNTITFTGGVSRQLDFQLAHRARRPGGTTWSATVRTEADARGLDRAGLASSGMLTYAHLGQATKVSLALTGVNRQRGETLLKSGPIRIAPGDHLIVHPQRSLARVTIRDRRGHARRLVMRSRAHAPARLTVGSPRLARHRVSFRVRIADLNSRAVLGAVLRVMRGHRLIATRSAAVRHPRNGSRVLRFRLAGSLHGRYRLLVNAELVGIRSGGLGSATARSRALISFH
jgi:hypothetical protein